MILKKNINSNVNKIQCKILIQNSSNNQDNHKIQCNPVNNNYNNNNNK